MKLWVLYVCVHRLAAVCAPPPSFGHLFCPHRTAKNAARRKCRTAQRPLKGKTADWDGSGFEVFLLVTIPQLTPQKHAGQAITIGGGRSAVEMVWGDLARDGMVCKSALDKIRMRGVIQKSLLNG